MTEIPTLQWIDWGIIVLMGISVLFGVLRGFIRSAFSLVTWVSAVVIAKVVSPNLASQFVNIFPIETLRVVVAFSIIFLIVLFVGMIAGRLVSAIFKTIGLSGLDRLLGIFFGALRGALIVAVLLMIGGMTGFDESEAWKKSPLRPYWDPAIVWLQQIMEQPLPEKDQEADKSKSKKKS